TATATAGAEVVALAVRAGDDGRGLDEEGVAEAPAPAPIAADEGMGSWQTRHTTGGPSPSALSNGGSPRYPAATTSASPAPRAPQAQPPLLPVPRPHRGHRGDAGRRERRPGPGQTPEDHGVGGRLRLLATDVDPGPARAEPGPVRRPHRPGLERPVYVIAATRRRAARTG